ncbi:hypothetical protein J4526_08260 [Desulfurococcaceae archaeon MEX13E-LK6-19]|nr:hypothetical protein J4526_08260 [Desulfurococcaceae archaeon MEX13E-LK6-19]
MPPIEYELALFIQRLYDVSFPGVYRMAKHFSMDYSDFMLRINKIYSYNFRFKFTIDLTKIDLRKTYVLIEDTINISEPIPFLRAYIRLLPNLTYMAFFTPLKSNIYTFVYNVLRRYGIDTSNIREVYTAKYAEENRTLLTLYKWDIDSFDEMASEKEWMKIIQRTGYYLETLTDDDLPIFTKEYKGPKVLREIYLRILKEIEYNPFLPMYEISRKAGVRQRDVVRAVKMFESVGIFKGIRISWFPWIKAADLFFISFIKADSYRDAMALLKAASEFPMFTGGIINIDNSVMLTFLGNGKAYPVFEKTMHALEKEFSYNVKRIHLGFSSQSRRFSLPYIHGIEYNKYRKYWNVILRSN